MSGRVGDLSPKQANALKAFRENVSDILKPEHDDYYLLRWLRARNFDLKKSEAMLRNDYEWRKTIRADSILEEFQIPDVIQKYYTGGLYGSDKEGSPVWYDPFGRIDFKGILRTVKKSDVIKSKVHIIEKIYKLFEEESEKREHRIDQLVIVFDLEGFGMKHLWKPGADVFCEILAMFEDHYPETLKLSFVVNAPRIFPLAYSIIRPFLSEETVRKVHILGSNYKEVLLRYIDADKLPQHWGGSCCDPDGDPRCVSKINFGGPVPTELYSSKESVAGDLSSFTAVTIGRGSSLQLDFEVKKPDSALRWQFQTEGFDIGFGVYRRTGNSRQKAGDMETIQPTQRVNSHMVPEDGSIRCSQPGTYVLRFDNTFSWTRGKKLLYQVELIEESDNMADLDTSDMPPGESKSAALGQH